MLWHRSSSPDRRTSRFGPARNRKIRPALDALEDRQLMSLGAEFAGTVNAPSSKGQFHTDNATNSSGETVVVWEDEFSANDMDIRAQRYNAFGGKLGPEIVVAITGQYEYQPKVAIDDYGDFVVAYTRIAGNDSNVLAQKFDSNGNAAGLVQVANSTFSESEPDVAMDAYGDFVVSYTYQAYGASYVYADRYSSAGYLTNVIGVSTSFDGADHSSVAMSRSGRFDVAWEQVYTANDHDVYMSRFDATGALLGTNTISYSPGFDAAPSVSMDDAGDAVVAWSRNHDVKAMRVYASGAQGREINIASTAASEDLPSVALRRDGGGFVVAYQSLGNDGENARVAEVSAFNAVATYTAPLGYAPSVSIDAYGDYFVSYEVIDYYTNDPRNFDPNIHGRRGFLSS